MTLRAVLFDLDGTLVDSLGGLHRAAVAAMAAEGLRRPDAETVRGFIGHGVPTLVRRLTAWAGAPDRAAEVEAAFHRIYDADPVTGTEPLPGARDLLAGLSARGVAMALVTNKPEGPTRTILDALALGRFGCVVGGDTLAARKPDPRPLRHALIALGAAPEAAVMVGDSAVDADAAAAVPMRCVILRGGYGAAPPPWLPVANSLRDVADLLDGPDLQ